jgi:dipeptidase E
MDELTFKLYVITMWILAALGVYFLYDRYGHIVEYYFNRNFNYATLSIPPSQSRNLLLYSNSTMKITGDHLGYGRPSLRKFLEPHGVKEVLFIPYAWPNMRDGVDTQAATKMYNKSVLPAFKSVGCDCKLLDTTISADQQIAEINRAQAVYMCGGNTFWLTRFLHQPGVAQALRDRINSGMPYVSASAGTNATCPTMQTTNDMPNCCVDGCDVLGVIPFQINVHYNDYTEGHGFGGEERSLRLCEYLQENRTFNNGNPSFVLGIREGSMLHVSGDQAELLGLKSRPAIQLQILNGKLTRKNLPIGSRVDSLLRQEAF